MEDAQKKVAALLEKGRAFTYENFTTKGEYGYPDAFTADWVSWTTRAEGAVKSLCGSNSGQAKLIGEAHRVILIGNGTEKFRLAKSYFIGALEATEAILKEDTFGELVDRDKAGAPIQS